MGRDRVKLEVGASVSRHNSEQDRIDDALWAEIEQRIRELLADPRYEGISPWAF